MPGKNTRPLGGKPLIVWTIDAVKNLHCICEVLVSTDDCGIAGICVAAGARVPWMRPVELASDTASSVDVTIHALDWYEANSGIVDGVLLLQPTSPFRTTKTIASGIELFIQHNQQPVVGISPVQAHPLWMVRLHEGYAVPYVTNNAISTRSQDLPSVYTINGSFYLISPSDLRINRSFFTEKAIPLITESPVESIDIDTEWDFSLAELLANRGQLM